MNADSNEATILFADIGGSTALYETMGDVEAHRRVADSLAFMRTAIERHHGILLRTVGDSSLASFDSCDGAFLAACEMQRLHAGGPLSVRVGFHVGPVIHDGGDVYGQAVNVAARIASFARTDEIAASADAVLQLSAVHARRAQLLDTRELKGLSEPLGIHRLAWEDKDALATQIAARPSAGASSAGCLDLVRGGVQLTVDDHRPRVSIGRAVDCDLAVDDEHASRSHATIELARGQFLLIDDSTNGTWLLRDGRPPVLIHRDSIVLDGDGRLGLGATPTESGATPIAWRIAIR